MRGRERRLRRTLLGALAVVAALPALVLACAKVAGIDDLEIGECKGGKSCFAPSSSTSGSSSSTGTNRPSDAAPSSAKDGDTEEEASAPFSCPSGTKGAAMVVAGPPTARFCIDRTETTVGQYREFLDSSPSTASQPSECAWNTTFTPAGSLAHPGDLPQTNVDWCDARAYCEWAGKRLCGKVSGGALSKEAGEIHKADVDEWFMACTENGARKYPYGDDRIPNACNLRYADGGGVRVREIGATHAACVGGYDGIFDMLGNVWEWVDDCFVVNDSTMKNWACWPRGGGYEDSETAISCVSATGLHQRSGYGDTIGFRCCSN